MPRPPKSAEAKKDSVKKAGKPSTVKASVSESPRALPSKPAASPATPKEGAKTQLNAKSEIVPKTPTSEKKRKAEQSDEPKKAAKLEVSSSPATSAPKKSPGNAAKKKSDEPKAQSAKTPSGLDAIVLTKGPPSLRGAVL